LAGRTRDRALDASIRAASLSLLHEVGWPRFSVEAVAASVGIPKSTIYTRWPSRVELAVAVLGEWLVSAAEEVAASEPAPLRDLLDGLILQELKMATSNEGRAVANLLLAESDSSRSLSAPLQHGLADYRSACRSVVAKATGGAGLDPQVDTEMFLEILLGAAWIRALRGATADQATASEITDQVSRLFALSL
jgi:AcrR family transcriptional regulator